MRARRRLARAVIDCPSLEAANATLNALGVRTELDLEAESGETRPSGRYVMFDRVAQPGRKAPPVHAFAI